MHVHTLDARTINALANIGLGRYDTPVSGTQDNVVSAWREMAACHAAACAALERELGARLGLRVTLEPKKRGGALTLQYATLDQLDRVLTLLRAG